MNVSGVPLWRWIFGIGVIHSALGLALRYLITQKSLKFVESKTAERKLQDSMWTILSPYCRALLGTAGCWFLFDFVGYGLKQNDAAIFGESVSASYAQSMLQVLWSRLSTFQLSFQSLPGVTVMAISAEIYPSIGKLGATVGSYLFSELQSRGEERGICWTVFATSALLCYLQPSGLPPTTGTRLTRLTS